MTQDGNRDQMTESGYGGSESKPFIFPSRKTWKRSKYLIQTAYGNLLKDKDLKKWAGGSCWNKSKMRSENFVSNQEPVTEPSMGTEK